MADWLIQQGITIYRSGPPLFHQFIDTLSGKEEFPNVRMVRLGTQAVSVRDVESYKKHFSPDCIFTNSFASTEAGSLRTYFIDKETQFPTNTVPVGFAVDDRDLWLVDDDGNQIGFNQVGEIVVSSKYLALGYWGKPDLSREAFQPDPRGGDRRIFRTGDMGYMLLDGCLEHRGRKDFQVKIRGYRVEVAEWRALTLGSAGPGSTSLDPATWVDPVWRFYSGDSSAPFSAQVPSLTRT